MTLKKTLFVIGWVIALLLPAGQLFKAQNPWNCFHFTFDELYFAQAAQNWFDGLGYRMSGEKPFDPKITVGVPMAWGASLLHLLTGADIAHAGRMFVYGCFVLLLLSIGWGAYRRGKSWIAVPVAIGIFAYGLSKAPSGGYFVFGFLGEMPALLLGSFAYRALDDRRYFRAGIFSAATFVIKPTYSLFVAAVGMTSLLRSRPGAAYAGFGVLLVIGCSFLAILTARQESLAEYISVLVQGSKGLSHNPASAGLLTFLENSGWTAAGLVLALFAFGLFGFVRYRRSKESGHLAAFILLMIGVGYYLVTGHSVVEKQWGAILAMVWVGVSMHAGALIGSFFAGWIPREQMQAIVVSIVVTYLLAIGQNAHHRFKRLPETACASKEQSAINRDLRAMIDRNELRPEQIGLIAEKGPLPFLNLIYRSGSKIVPVFAWKEFKPPLPTWIAGETRSVVPPPIGCRAHFQGSAFSLVHCPIVSPKVAEPSRIRTKNSSRPVSAPR